MNSTKFLNVHSIALQVPIPKITAHDRPTIGVWTTASRQRVGIRDDSGGETVRSGPHTQVSRLGNPLINEVIIPMGKKDYWNTQHPAHDKQFAQFYANLSLPGLSPRSTRPTSRICRRRLPARSSGRTWKPCC